MQQGEDDESNEMPFIDDQASSTAASSLRQVLLRQQQDNKTTDAMDDKKKEYKSGRLMNSPSKVKGHQAKKQRQLMPVQDECSTGGDICGADKVPTCYTKKTSKAETGCEYKTAVNKALMNHPAGDTSIGGDKTFISCGCCDASLDADIKDGLEAYCQAPTCSQLATRLATDASCATEYDTFLNDKCPGPIEALLAYCKLTAPQAPAEETRAFCLAGSFCKTGNNQDILDWCGLLDPENRCCVDGEDPIPKATVCNFPGEVTLCPQACRGFQACYNIAEGNPQATARIGVASCVGDQSCSFIAATSFPEREQRDDPANSRISLVIKDGGCYGDFSCRFLGGAAALDIYVGPDSCRANDLTSDRFQCYSVGYKSPSIDIRGPKSCSYGRKGCYYLGYSSTQPIDIALGICSDSDDVCFKCGYYDTINPINVQCNEQCRWVVGYTFPPFDPNGCDVD